MSLIEYALASGKKIELTSTTHDEAAEEAKQHFDAEDHWIVEAEPGRFIASQPDFTLSDKIEC